MCARMRVPFTLARTYARTQRNHTLSSTLMRVSSSLPVCSLSNLGITDTGQIRKLREEISVKYRGTAFVDID